jgi:hypothetical protein
MYLLTVAPVSRPAVLAASTPPVAIRSQEHFFPANELAVI